MPESMLAPTIQTNPDTVLPVYPEFSVDLIDSSMIGKPTVIPVHKAHPFVAFGNPKPSLLEVCAKYVREFSCLLDRPVYYRNRRRS